MSCCRRHTEGTVSACCYSFPIGASKATDSCGTQVERDGRSREEPGSGKSPRGLSSTEIPVSFSFCSYTINCLGGGLLAPLVTTRTLKCHLAQSRRSLLQPGTIPWLNHGQEVALVEEGSPNLI